MRRMVRRWAIVFRDDHTILLGRKGIEIESRADTDDKKHGGGRGHSDPSRIYRRLGELGDLGAPADVRRGIVDSVHYLLRELRPKLSAWQPAQGGAVGLQMLDEDTRLGRLF